MELVDPAFAQIILIESGRDFPLQRNLYLFVPSSIVLDQPATLSHNKERQYHQFWNVTKKRLAQRNQKFETVGCNGTKTSPNPFVQWHRLVLDAYTTLAPAPVSQTISEHW